jgi:hypothetical protein
MLRIALLASFLFACGAARPVYTGTVEVKSAELVAIDPDVQTVADADQPVFFVRGNYWLFHDGRWWRSASLGGTFVFDPRPPVPVRQIRQPYQYTNYNRDRPAEQTAQASEPAPATAVREKLRDPARLDRERSEMAFPR